VAEKKGPGNVSKALNAAWIRPFLFLIFIVVAWDLTIRLFRIPPYQIPAPGDVVVVLWQDWPELARQAWPTTYATLCGFLLSALFGIPLAMLIAGSKTVESYVYPLLVFSQSVPKVAIAPLFVLWVGTQIESKIVMALLVSIFPMVVDSVVGLRAVDPEMLDLARTYRGSKLQLFWKIRFPNALPNIFAGMKVAISLSLVGTIVGEFVGSNYGLGYVILQSQGTYNTPRAFAAILVLAVLGTVLYQLVDWAKRRAMPWHVSHRSED
jgi:NitT/TauT family transport system permease protein